MYSVSILYIYLHVYTAYAEEQAAARNRRILPAIQHAQHRHSLMLCSVSVDKKFLLHALPALVLGICVMQIAIGLVWLKECTDLFHPVRRVGQDISSIKYVDTWGINSSTLIMLRTMNSTWVQWFNPSILCFPGVDLRIMEYVLGITGRIRFAHYLCFSRNLYYARSMNGWFISTTKYSMKEIYTSYPQTS